jgi:hypothetical protein
MKLKLKNKISLSGRLFYPPLDRIIEAKIRYTEGFVFSQLAAARERAGRPLK